jgi:hypothetical protein
MGPAPAKRPPPFGFFKGVALGFIVVIPAVALAVWVLSWAGVIGRRIAMAEAIRMTTMFAGAAAVLTAGGIGRLAAFSSTLPAGRRGAVVRATRVQAIAGAGLTLIAAIPFGHLPDDLKQWAWIGVAGAATGAIAGALIGLVCGAPLSDQVTLPELFRRVPALAEWAKHASNDPRFQEQARRGRKPKGPIAEETPPKGPITRTGTPRAGTVRASVPEAERPTAERTGPAAVAAAAAAAVTELDASQAVKSLVDLEAVKPALDAAEVPAAVETSAAPTGVMPAVSKPLVIEAEPPGPGPNTVERMIKKRTDDTPLPVPVPLGDELSMRNESASLPKKGRKPREKKLERRVAKGAKLRKKTRGDGGTPPPEGSHDG